MRSIAAPIIFHVVAYSFCTKLLFAGAEVKFHLAAGMESGFIIVKSGKLSNLVFFEEEIILRCTSEGDNTKQKVRIFHITKYGSFLLQKKRPMLSNEQVLLQFGSSKKILPMIVEVVQFRTMHSIIG